MWIENRSGYRIKQIICAILGVCASLIFTFAVLNRQEVVAAKRLTSAQAELSDAVFRFHVLANSDREEDQNLKLLVRDRILLYMRESMSEGQELLENEKLQAVKSWTVDHLEEIEQIAERVIREEGYDYPVNARVLKCYFPDRRYGEILFPKGYYEALRVEIGAAAGHNWWCVLYPSLCFMDATSAVVSDEGEQELEAVLSGKSYETVTATSGNFKIKSFFYELFKERAGRQMEEGQ